MKNGLRLIVIVLKTAVAAYLIGCVGLSWLQNSGKKIGKVGRMHRKEHRNDQTESRKQKANSRHSKIGGAPAGSFCSRGSWEMAWKWTGPILALKRKSSTSMQ